MRQVLTLATALAVTVIIGNNRADAGSYAAAEINLRAGPGIRYPSVRILPAGAPFKILGCTKGYSWCDIGAFGGRGWVSGAYIGIEYDSQTLRLPAYLHSAHESAMPIDSFDINNYWFDHYSDQGFYNDIETWDNVDWEADVPPPGWGQG